ncbi:hypothetical protein [uncultured virus]|uniref:Uncharacterized protein n=1 Tax=uncultured virus TaxID=340016 RepID=A0A5Q0TWH1_9VIRU|nr:hypothetical protein [uncultured virus]
MINFSRCRLHTCTSFPNAPCGVKPIPIATVKLETTQKVVEDVEKTPNTSNLRPVREFLELTWKKYEKLVIASLLYNTIKQEEQLDN